MTRLLVIHHDKTIRARLEMLAKLRHEVVSVADLAAGIKELGKHKADAIVVGHDSKKEEAARLLRYMRDNRMKAPVVAVISPGAGATQPLLMKLGAKGFIEYPVDQERFDQAVAKAIQAHGAASAGPPPISEEELSSNLSMLEVRLNQQMKCFAGKNQVFIQSTILGGATTKPRICLRCALRGEFGLKREVYYEFIRDVCCAAPGECEAVQRFNATRESA